MPVPVFDQGASRARFELWSPEAVQAHFAKKMAVHDRRPVDERWGGNQWGEGWVVRPDDRRHFERRAPLLARDVRLEAFAEVADE